jgi:hypothetical protein
VLARLLARFLQRLLTHRRRLGVGRPQARLVVLLLLLRLRARGLRLVERGWMVLVRSSIFARKGL